MENLLMTDSKKCECGGSNEIFFVGVCNGHIKIYFICENCKAHGSRILTSCANKYAQTATIVDPIALNQ